MQAGGTGSCEAADSAHAPSHVVEPVSAASARDALGTGPAAGAPAVALAVGSTAIVVRPSAADRRASDNVEGVALGAGSTGGSSGRAVGTAASVRRPVSPTASTGDGAVAAAAGGGVVKAEEPAAAANLPRPRLEGMLFEIASEDDADDDAAGGDDDDVVEVEAVGTPVQDGAVDVDVAHVVQPRDAPLECSDGSQHEDAVDGYVYTPATAAEDVRAAIKSITPTVRLRIDGSFESCLPFTFVAVVYSTCSG